MSARPSRRGFSLVELLLAIFILGIGIISIAALFPAGIAQQRQSADDAIGPIVANNAISILRGKLKPEMFGWFDIDGDGVPEPEPLGDWGWRRPGFILADGGLTLPNGTLLPKGTINVFEFSNGTSHANTEIPYSQAYADGFLPAVPNEVVFTQRERYYPMVSNYESTETPPRPQYVWDCMFRRFQGRILVAIFVYRTAEAGGEPLPYVVERNVSNPTIPPVPVAVDFTTGLIDPWDVAGDASIPGPDGIIPGTWPGSTFNHADQAQGWQAPGQWMLDQNNNIHRVLSGRRNADDGPVELMRPVPDMPPLPIYDLLPSSDPGRVDVVKQVWFIPPFDEKERSLTPVYVTVKEL